MPPLDHCCSPLHLYTSSIAVTSNCLPLKLEDVHTMLHWRGGGGHSRRACMRASHPCTIPFQWPCFERGDGEAALQRHGHTGAAGLLTRRGDGAAGGRPIRPLVAAAQMYVRMNAPAGNPECPWASPPAHAPPERCVVLCSIQARSQLLPSVLRLAEVLHRGVGRRNGPGALIKGSRLEVD